MFQSLSRTESVSTRRKNSNLGFWGGDSTMAGWWSLGLSVILPARYLLWLYTHSLLHPISLPLNSDQGSPQRPRLLGFTETMTLCPLSLQQGVELWCLSALAVVGGMEGRSATVASLPRYPCPADPQSSKEKFQLWRWALVSYESCKQVLLAIKVLKQLNLLSPLLQFP